MALNGYTKLSSSILASTIWREKNETRLVWITMLALADADGQVEASVPGLADLARVPLAACEEALQALQRPDPYSRTPDHDGRRIEPVRGGWLLLNHASYREHQNKDERREYLRVKQQESRNRRRSTPNVDSQQNQQTSTQAEALPEAEASTPVTPSADAPAAEQRKGERRKTHNGHVPGFCDWICFPKRLREQFAAASGEDISTSEKRTDVEDRVEIWAQQTREAWQGKQIADSSPWAFWNARWREWVSDTAPGQPRWQRQYPRRVQ